MSRPYLSTYPVAYFVRLLLVLLICWVAPLQAANRTISISVQDMDIHKVMKMLSMEHRLNIFLADGVNGKVSVNLYDMDVVDAIRSISDAAGYAVEQRNGSYFIIERDDVGKYNSSGLTRVRSFKIQYTKPSEVEKILTKHLSSFGKITSLEDRNLLIVEDLPESLKRVAALLKEIDRQPKQILIEAKILEVTLTDDASFGLDWSKLFTNGVGKKGGFGVQDLASPGSPGLFFNYLSPNINIALNALKKRGRLRTLSTPKLLAMEDRTAETVVGTRLGFRVTTTINQVTSESVEFLETGIILKVTPSVDREGQILLDIHPEVSAGSVSDDGIPSKSTTQLSTRMLVPDGQTVFLGGLIKQNSNESREGVPILGDLPVIGNAFSNRSKNWTTTEIIVLITPKVIDFHAPERKDMHVEKISRQEQLLSADEAKVEEKINELMGGEKSEANTGETPPTTTDQGIWRFESY